MSTSPSSASDSAQASKPTSSSLPKPLESGRSTLFAGHALAVAPTAKPLNTFTLPESPLLARLKQFIPALKAANECTAPTTTIEEVLEGASDEEASVGSGDSPRSQQAQANGSGSGSNVSSLLNDTGVKAIAGKAVQMEVVIVPDGEENAEAQVMVDKLAGEDADSEKADIEVGADSASVQLEVETSTSSPKPVHPGIRVLPGPPQTTTSSSSNGIGGGSGSNSGASSAANIAVARPQSEPLVRVSGAARSRESAVGHDVKLQDEDDAAPRKRLRGRGSGNEEGLE